MTYLVDFDNSGDSISLSFQLEMVPWIGAASLFYGMLALLLALIMGGYTPVSIVERGGLRRSLGLSRNPRNAHQRRESRKSAANSPHGQLAILAYDRDVMGYKFLSTHGGLMLLAVPFQVLLATIPLAVLLLLPENLVRNDRGLELALLVYLICLVFVMRYFPKIAYKYIGAAAVTRKWLVSMTRLSWLAPILVLYMMGRMAAIIVLGWIGEDGGLSFSFEKSFFESLLGVASIPDTSFIDLLTALAVMPMAAFTTLAVLGGCSGEPPEWMRIGNELIHEEAGEERDRPAFLDSMVVKGAGMVLAGSATAALVATTGAVGKSQMAVQGIGAMAAGAPGVTTAATQGVGMAQSGTELLSSGDGISAASDIIGDSSNQLSSITDLAQDEFDLGNFDDIISTESNLDDHEKPAIRGLGPS
tara:strand:+ start:1879 stop:3129 length:1251 start_codon:yes stop_codon:yes gene_type:complete